MKVVFGVTPQAHKSQEKAILEYFVMVAIEYHNDRVYSEEETVYL